MPPFRLYLFGAPRLEQHENPLNIQRRKTLALLAYLAVTGKQHTREALATLFWPEHDQSGALANLRRDLSRLKNVLGDELLAVDRMQAGLSTPEEIWVDVVDFQRKLAQVREHSHQPGDLCPTCLAALEEAVALYSDRFMAGFNLPDSTEFDDWQFFLSEDLRQGLVEALQVLIDWHVRQGEYERAIESARQWLAVDQLHEPVHRRLMELYAWSGQQAAALRQYQECVKVLHDELGVVPEEETTALYQAIKTRQLEMPARPPRQGLVSPDSGTPEQEIRYCKSRDGVTLAYATIGRGPVLVKAANWMSHLEFDWHSPVWQHWLLALAEKHTLIRYDERGCGLSAWDVEDMSFEAWLSDLEAVVEATGVERFPLLGISQGGAIAIAYATRHPEKVSHLILYGSYARGRRHRLTNPRELEELELYQQLIRIGWGKENDAFRQVFSSMFLPEGTPKQMRAFNELQRISSTPENAARIVDEFSHIDVRHLASQIRIPTLILHSKGDLRIPFEEGELLASLIPGAQFVPLDSKNHVLLEHEPAWKRFIFEIENFLKTPSPPLTEVEPESVPSITRQPVEIQAAALLAEQPVPDKLPAASSPFIGRRNELAELQQMLSGEDDLRLVTIQGPGGIGKTRLSIEAARQAAPAFPDGTYFVSLAPIESAGEILTVLASAIGFSFHDSGEPRRQLLDTLRDRRLLLVLDNFEHVLEGAQLVANILETAPGIKIMATSRERLNLSGELVYPLGGLTYPGSEADDLLSYDAVNMLIQAARRHQPDLKPSAKELKAIGRICSLVQGMPLALVLAGGWLEVLSFEEIAAEIENSLDILETEMRDVPARQRSVRAVFEYSWQLLPEQEQQVFMKLAVFRGGFDRAAAQAVAGGSIRALLGLTNKSWVYRDEPGRYQIHELLRQYGQESLQAAPEKYVAIKNQHARYYAGLLEKLEQQMRGAKQSEALDTLEAEFENVRSAWRWLVENQQVATAIHSILPGLFSYCEARARAFDLMPMLEAAHKVLPDSTAATEPEKQLLLSILLTARGAFYPDGTPMRYATFGILMTSNEKHMREAWTLGSKPEVIPQMGIWGLRLAYQYGRSVDLQAGIERLRELAPVFENAGLLWELAYCRLHLVQMFQVENYAAYQTEVEAYIQEALRIFRELGDEREHSNTLRAYGQQLRFQHRYQEAIETWRQAQDVANDWTLAADINWQLGDIYIQIGEYEVAFQYYLAMRQAYQQRGYKQVTAAVLSKESYEALRYSDLAFAQQTREQSLAIVRQIGDTFSEAWNTWELGEIQRVTGDLGCARQNFERARQMFTEQNEHSGLIFYYRGMGDIALSEHDYPLAEQLFAQSIAYAHKENHDWGLAYAHTGASRATTAQGHQEASQEHLLKAIQHVLKADELGMLMIVLSGVGQYCAQRGELDLAKELNQLVSKHPATWREIKQRVEHELESLGAAHKKQGQGGPPLQLASDPWEIAKQLEKHLAGE